MLFHDGVGVGTKQVRKRQYNPFGIERRKNRYNGYSSK